MGGDNAPDATLEGAYLATKVLKNNERIVLVGDKKYCSKLVFGEQYRSLII
jgi:fatty acid/phospholipid biosynthesis enzyme